MTMTIIQLITTELNKLATYNCPHYPYSTLHPKVLLDDEDEVKNDTDK